MIFQYSYVCLLKSPTAITRKINKLAICNLALIVIPLFGWSQTAGQLSDISNTRVSISLSCGQNCSWSYRATGSTVPYKFAPAAFELDGKQISADVRHFSRPVLQSISAMESPNIPLKAHSPRTQIFISASSSRSTKQRR